VREFAAIDVWLFANDYN